MAFDGMFTHAMVSELRAKILNGRVMKISQPYPNEVILTIRSNRKNYRRSYLLTPTMPGCKLHKFHIKIRRFQLNLQ